MDIDILLALDRIDSFAVELVVLGREVATKCVPYFHMMLWKF